MPIHLLTGIPGSGKSLMAVKMIHSNLKHKEFVITNFPVNVKDKFKSRLIYYSSGDDWWNYPSDLIEKIRDIRKDTNKRITVYIDECQMLFDSRDWNRPGRRQWNEFFSIHRHLRNVDVILICQNDKLLDKKVRAFLEECYTCRKISNLGGFGLVLGALTLYKLHQCEIRYYSMRKMHLGQKWYLCRKKWREMYNTYEEFGGTGDVK